MTYQEQLKSPKWQKKRLQIMELKNFKCEICGSEEKQLNVHHRFYIKGRKAWEYDNDVFQVLCEDCHKEEHNKQNNTEIPSNYKIIFNHILNLSNDDFDAFEFVFNECIGMLSDDENMFYRFMFMFNNYGLKNKIIYDIDFAEEMESNNIKIHLLKEEIKKLNK